MKHITEVYREFSRSSAEPTLITPKQTARQFIEKFVSPFYGRQFRFESATCSARTEHTIDRREQENVANSLDGALAETKMKNKWKTWPGSSRVKSIE